MHKFIKGDCMKLRNQISNLIILLLIFHLFLLDSSVFDELIFDLIKNNVQLVSTLSRYQLFLIVIDFFAVWGYMTPFVVVFFIPVYKQYSKSRYIYMIGKNNNYTDTLKLIKRKIASINVAIFTAFLILYITISLIYSISTGHLTKENLEIITNINRFDLYFMYISLAIAIYIYTYALIGFSENVKSIYKLIILFIIAYFTLLSVTVNILGQKINVMPSAVIPGGEASPIYLISTIVLPLILHLSYKFERKEVAY